MQSPFVSIRVCDALERISHKGMWQIASGSERYPAFKIGNTRYLLYVSTVLSRKLFNKENGALVIIKVYLFCIAPNRLLSGNEILGLCHPAIQKA